MGNGYLSRIVDAELDAALEFSGAVLIKGSKWCGKTWTAAERAASAIYMQDPDEKRSYLDIADNKPSVLLEGRIPRLIDEWQTAPVLWDAVRFAVDHRGEPGQFILTGSAVPTDDATMHTGTGRFSRIMMRPMTLFESLESKGNISLESLFNGGDVEGASQLSIEDLALALVRGGWPASVGKKRPIALRHARSYVDSVIDIDISRVDGVEKNPARVRSLMRSLARNISTMAKLPTIMDDMSNDVPISERTISSYMNALRHIFVIEDLPAWSPAMRSKTALRTSPKRHFVDPSIAAALLRASPESLMRDFNTFGLLFESLCVRDLRVYAQALDGDVFHYRDRSGLEADAIVHLRDGRWGAVEVKMGAKEVEKAIEDLIELRNRVNIDKMKEPSFLAVVTATKYPYRQEDGVYIVPIGCLKN